MKRKYLGDSFDIVKRFWAERLAGIAPLFAHPTFIPSDLKTDFERLVRMILDLNGLPPKPFGLFLDPDTGVSLPTSANQTAAYQMLL